MSGDPLQAALPEDAVAHALPGTRPMAPGDWLRVDDAFAGQMALRDALLADNASRVRDCLTEGRAAADELLDLVLETVGDHPDYRMTDAQVTRPDGQNRAVDRNDPLATIGRLAQEDFCLMQPSDTGHRLVGAVLCFPASWTLAQKIGRDLGAIHGPIAEYDAAIGPRVQRLFDGVRVGHPLVRFNRLEHAHARLHNPGLEFGRRPPYGLPARFIRAERQVIRRLPRTGAVVFSIHTYLVKKDANPA